MSDTTYRVVIDLSTKGDLGAQMSGATSGLLRLDQKISGAKVNLASFGSAFADVGKRAADAFTGAVEKVGSLIATTGKLGAIAGVGMLVHSVGKLNNELESAQLSLAGIINANGYSNGLGQAFGMAGEQMAKMRQDAKALPGEFSDLRNIFTNISVPGMQAGMDVDRLRNLSSMIMATSAALQVPMEVAARESSMLLMGRAGAHNILGMKLAGLGGDKAESFNKMSTLQRADVLEKELTKFKPLIEQQGKTLDGLFSTFIDNTKIVRTELTANLFSSVKGTLSTINNWFDANQDKVVAWATELGIRISNAYDYGLERMREWWPAIRSFATHAYEELASIWTRIEPIVERVGEKLQAFLNDPNSIGRLEHMLELYAGVKVGGAIGPGMLQGAGSLLSAFGGGEGAAGAAGAAGAGGLAVGGAVLAALAVDGIALGGAFRQLTDETNTYHADASMHWTKIKSETEHVTTRIKEDFEKIGTAALPLVDLLGNHLIHTIHAWTSAFEGVVSAAEGVTSFFQKLGAVRLHDTNEEPIVRNEPTYMPAPVVMNAFADEAEKRAAKNAPKGAGGGGGGTHIQKVEIVVSGAEDPSRIARRIEDHLSHIKRFPRSARNVPNFSSVRG